MNLKLVALSIVTCLCLISCSKTKLEGESLVRKRITQKIESNGMGMITDLKIESIKKLNDSTYQGIHNFFNEMFKKEVRVTRIYSFTINLDSIIKSKNVQTEMKSENEWVKVGT